MFDIGIGELLVIIIVAVVVIGPKDLPLAMRTAGRWIGKMRRVSAHFRSGIDTMVREAELAEPPQRVAPLAFLGAGLVFRHREAGALGQVTHRFHEAQAQVLGEEAGGGGDEARAALVGTT